MSGVPIDLERRRPVWLALSELYLDTEIDASLPRIAEVLAQSPYRLDQLRAILFDEVHAVLHWNLIAPAGVWDGFDADWLASEVLKRCRRPRWLRAKISRAMPRHYWLLLESLIERLRATSPSTGNAELSHNAY